MRPAPLVGNPLSERVLRGLRRRSCLAAVFVGTCWILVVVVSSGIRRFKEVSRCPKLSSTEGDLGFWTIFAERDVGTKRVWAVFLLPDFPFS